MSNAEKDPEPVTASECEPEHETNDTHEDAEAAPNTVSASPSNGDAVVASPETPADEVKPDTPTKSAKQVVSREFQLMFATDRYCSSDDKITWIRDAAVKIQYGSENTMEGMPSLTVMSMMESTLKKSADHRAIGYKEGGEWRFLTYRQYYNHIWTAAKSFIKVGLEPYNGVGILGFNSKEWFYSNFGAIFAGGLSTGIYTTNSPDAVKYVLKHCDANVCVVENDVQLKKVLQVWDDLPSLKAVVQYTGKPETERDNVYSWEEFIKLGQDVPDSEVKERIDAQCVNKCCALIYTSGTTGTPKGVMLSHDNLTYAARVIAINTEVVYGQEKIISYLPLSHIAGQMLDMYVPVCHAVTVYLAQPDALKGSLNTTMKEVLPTIFFGVPRVFEKMEEKLRHGLSESQGLRKKLAEWARGMATKNSVNMTKNQGTPFGMMIANRILRKIHMLLGLTECKRFYSGAAPLSPETHRFFASIGLPVCEVYGMSECTGAHTMTCWSENRKHWKPASAGYYMSGYSYELLDKDENGNGEVAMVGRHLFMGYLNEEEKTKETFDSEYRLKSGDVGYTDSDGFLFITGRIKELLITAGGENVAPVPIENTVKEALPQISNCMLIGDKMKFLSLLITMKTEVDLDTLQPKDEFTEQTIEWCKSLGSNATKVQDVLDRKDPAVEKAIQAGIDAANSASESRAKKIAKFAILPVDFSIPGGELGPTLKLKRSVVLQKYEDLIASLYKD